jgi:hypothetical protein
MAVKPKTGLSSHQQRTINFAVSSLESTLPSFTGAAGVIEAAAEILSTVPGIKLVDLSQPSVGLMSNYLRVLPTYERDLYLNELEAARDAGVDALVEMAMMTDSAVRHPATAKRRRECEIVRLVTLRRCSAQRLVQHGLSSSP